MYDKVKIIISSDTICRRDQDNVVLCLFVCSEIKVNNKLL